LAQAIMRVVRNRSTYVKPHDAIAAHYNTGRTVRDYESLYRELLQQRVSQVA